MSLRNFKTTVVLGEDFDMSKSPELAVFCQSLARKMVNADEPEQPYVFYNQFFGHININGSPVPSTITLGEQLALVDSFATQETTNPVNVRRILLDPQTGLVRLGKFIMPLMNHRYSNGQVDCNGRHRTLALSVIGYNVALILKKHHDFSATEAMALVESQLLGVQEVEYVISDEVLLIAPEKQGNAFIAGTADERLLIQQLDSFAVIAANGSRSVQDGEKESVLLSSQGVNPRKIDSVIKGLKSGIIKPDTALRLVAANTLYKNGAYTLKLHPNFKVGVYNQFFSSTPKKGITALLKAVWSYSSEDKVYPARWLLTGCANAAPRTDSKGNLKTAKPKLSSADPVLVEDTITALFERRALAEWRALLGTTFDLYGLDTSAPQEEVNLLELAVQMCHCQEGSSTIIDRLFRNSKSGVSAYTFIELLLAQIDAKLADEEVTGIEGYLGYAPSDEDDEEEEGEEAQGSVEDYDFDDEL